MPAPLPQLATSKLLPAQPPFLQVVDGSLAAAAAVLGGGAGLAAVTAVITAHEASAVKLLEELKLVVEANQARRKPKVRHFVELLLASQLHRLKLILCAVYICAVSCCNPALLSLCLMLCTMHHRNCASAAAAAGGQGCARLPA